MTALTVGLFGQSFAQQIFWHPGIDVVTAEFARSGYTATVVTSAAGGSAILKERAPTDNPSYYWWDADANAAGPLLTQALADIAAAPVKPTMFCMQIGDGDATSGLTFDAPRWKAAMANVLWVLRKACDPNVVTDNTLVPTRMNFVSRTLWTAPNVQAVREAQCAYDAQYSTNFGFDNFDLPLFGEDPLNTNEAGNRHYPPVSVAAMAWRFVQCCLDMAGSANARIPPLAGTVTRGTGTLGNDIRVPVTCSGRPFSKPSRPAHFAIRTAAGVVTQSDGLNFRWEGDTLVISPVEMVAAGAMLLYPYGELIVLDRERLITDAHGSPLRTLARTLP